MQSNCHQCGSTNAEGAKFCKSCGTSLQSSAKALTSADSVPCPTCHIDNLATAKFCKACGTHMQLGDQATSAPVSTDTVSTAAGAEAVVPSQSPSDSASVSTVQDHQKPDETPADLRAIPLAAPELAQVPKATPPAPPAPPDPPSQAKATKLDPVSQAVPRAGLNPKIITVAVTVVIVGAGAAWIFMSKNQQPEPASPPPAVVTAPAPAPEPAPEPAPAPASVQAPKPMVKQTESAAPAPKPAPVIKTPPAAPRQQDAERLEKANRTLDNLLK